MHTISAMARAAALPRRTVQHWHDRAVILPMNAAPIVYADDELILVRILATLAHLKPSISVLAEIASCVRLAIASDGDTPQSVLAAMKDARNGVQSYLLIAPDLADSEADRAWIWTVGASEQTLSRVLKGHVAQRPNLAWITVDLRYCFDIQLTGGAIYDSQEAD